MIWTRNESMVFVWKLQRQLKEAGESLASSYFLCNSLFQFMFRMVQTCGWWRFPWVSGDLQPPCLPPSQKAQRLQPGSHKCSFSIIPLDYETWQIWIRQTWEFEIWNWLISKSRVRYKTLKWQNPLLPIRAKCWVKWGSCKGVWWWCDQNVCRARSWRGRIPPASYVQTFKSLNDN